VRHDEFFNAEYRRDERTGARLYELWTGSGATAAGHRRRHRPRRRDLAVVGGAGVRVTLGFEDLGTEWQKWRTIGNFSMSFEWRSGGSHDRWTTS